MSTSMKSHSDEVLTNQLKSNHALITDTWKFLKCYTENLPASADDWVRIVNRGNSLIEQHGSSEFAKTLVIAAIDEIDRIAKFK